MPSVRYEEGLAERQEISQDTRVLLGRNQQRLRHGAETSTTGIEPEALDIGPT